MMETFLQTVFSNLLFALILAGVAWGTERFLRKPLLAHLLWVAVFIKLLSPPIISFSLPEIAFAPSFLIEKETISTSSGGGIFLITECLKYCGWEILFILWAGGSFLILGNCLRKIIHFNRLLCSGAGSPSQEIVKLAEELTSKLNLKRVPLLQITSAKISPMVWWIGGRIRIILPRVLLEKFSHEGIRWVLAHELTHVARRDYLIRWLEFLSSVIFWWNPLIRWVKNHLRQNEEICCDDQVIEIFAVNRRKYAETLLDAVELLSEGTLKAPAVASEMNGGGFLERRLRSIVSAGSHRPSYSQRVCMGLCVAVVLPMTCLIGQDSTSDRFKEEGQRAIVSTEKKSQYSELVPVVDVDGDSSNIPVRNQITFYIVGEPPFKIIHTDEKISEADQLTREELRLFVTLQFNQDLRNQEIRSLNIPYRSLQRNQDQLQIHRIQISEQVEKWEKYLAELPLAKKMVIQTIIRDKVLYALEEQIDMQLRNRILTSDQKLYLCELCQDIQERRRQIREKLLCEFQQSFLPVPVQTRS